MILTAYAVLLSTTIIFAWGFFKLVKFVEEQSDEISNLRSQLLRAENKIAIYEFGMELNKETLEAFQESEGVNTDE